MKEVVRIVACAPPRCNCPTLDLDFLNHTVKVKDDFGGECNMTLAEFAILARRFLEEV